MKPETFETTGEKMQEVGKRMSEAGWKMQEAGMKLTCSCWLILATIIGLLILIGVL